MSKLARVAESVVRRSLLAGLRILRRGGVRPSDAVLTRPAIARMFLKGQGIEIGGLHLPLEVPSDVTVLYVDRMPVSELRKHYPELRDEKLVEVDVIADGETLDVIPDGSQDFVIAKGFLEHCRNPLAAVRHMMRVLKMGGILYLAIPDKQLTFDRDRPVTPLAHVLADFQGKPPRDRREDFEEWTRLVYKIEDEAERKRRTDELLAMDYSIHYHVWTQVEMLELLVSFRRDLGLSFSVELICPIRYEVDIVLRKSED